jgi:signal peptidase I
MTYEKVLPELIGYASGFICVFSATSTLVFPTQVVGSSMYPTIKDKSWALVTSLPFQTVSRGDVIVLL